MLLLTHSYGMLRSQYPDKAALHYAQIRRP